MQVIQRYRLALHPLIAILALGSCISIGVTCSNPNWDFLASDEAFMATYGSVTLISILSAMIAIRRVGTVLSNLWLELIWLACLVAVFSFGSFNYYYCFGLAPYLSSFLFFTMVVAWVLQTATAATALSLIVVLTRLTWWTTSPQRERAAPKLSGLRAVIGIPRTLEDRRIVLRDVVGDFFFHHSIFRKQRYESTSIALIRGSAAFIALLGITLYALDLLVVLPLIESAFLPVRSSATVPPWLSDVKSSSISAHDLQLRSQPVLDDIVFVFGQMQYNYSTSSRYPSGPFSPTDFKPVSAGANISAYVISLDGSSFACPQFTTPWVTSNSSLFNDAATLNEPDTTRVYTGLNCSQQESNQVAARYIQLVVDYSNVTQSNDTSDISFYMVQNSFFISPETSKSFFDEVVPSGPAFPMTINARLRATTSMGGRRIIKPSWKDVLGVGANYIDFNTYTQTNIVPDTTAQTTYPDNVSTLLLSPAIDFSDFVNQEDYRQHTTLSGLASIGGLLTIIDGVFAIFFGKTLFQVILGSKVISPFGALGVIMREKIRRALHEQYPALHDHVRAGGMATFLGDIAIDLSILEDDPRSDAHPPIHPAAVTSVGSGSPEKESKSSYV